MKLLTASLLALGTISFPASVEAQSTTFLEPCEQHEVTETYTPGRINSSGNYIRGRVDTTRNRVECGGSYQLTNHYSHPYGSYQQPYYSQQQYPQQQYQQPQQPIVVQQAQCNGKIFRMGLGALGGGFAGRYAVGGKKSKHTILGTVLGAGAGSLIGRATC
jgi:hypothetical protein